MELAPHTVVAGRFRLERELGHGGMGSVWQAMDQELDVPCAIKFIDAALMKTAGVLVRFEREAKATAQLRSPHVVQILARGVCDGTPYIAMELLEGEDLRHRLKGVGRLTTRETLSVVEQVCRALSKAHALGIVHRDLKPENIFLSKDDDREITKVLDFGIAKKLESEGAVPSTTRTGDLLGSPYYMSPEQAQGTRRVDHRSDLWSLAVIVFECLTGIRPFESEALGDLLLKIFNESLPVPSLVANVPSGFDAWWIRAVARDPEARIGSAKEFAESLAAALALTLPNTEANDATAPTERAPQFPSDAPGPAATTGAPRGLHSEPSPLASTTSPSTRRSEAVTAPSRARARWGWLAGGGVAASGLVAALLLRPSAEGHGASPPHPPPMGEPSSSLESHSEASPTPSQAVPSPPSAASVSASAGTSAPARPSARPLSSSSASSPPPSRPHPSANPAPTGNRTGI